MMNPEIKANWVAALRSGKYKQDKGWLRTGNRFCCLGVLCDLHAKATGGKWGADDLYKGADTELPVAVRKWAGLRSSRPSIGNVHLDEINDGGNEFFEPPAKAQPFRVIADEIEAYPL